MLWPCLQRVEMHLQVLPIRRFGNAIDSGRLRPIQRLEACAQIVHGEVVHQRCKEHRWLTARPLGYPLDSRRRRGSTSACGRRGHRVVSGLCPPLLSGRYPASSLVWGHPTSSRPLEGLPVCWLYHPTPFLRARPLPIGGRGERRLAQPPTPARAGAEMAPSFPGHASRRTRQAPQEGGEHPVRPRGLALVEEGVGEGMAGALAAIAPGAFASRAVGIGPPRSDVLAPAPGTPQGTLLPPQRMEVGVTLLDLEEGVDIREHRHG